MLRRLQRRLDNPIANLVSTIFSPVCLVATTVGLPALLARPRLFAATRASAEETTTIVVKCLTVSTGRLRVFQHFHLPPINLVVFQGSLAPKSMDTKS